MKSNSRIRLPTNPGPFQVQKQSPGIRLPPRMHRVATSGYQRYLKNSKKLTADDAAALREELMEYAGDPQGMWAAIASLGVLAVLIEKQGDTEAGEQIRALIAAGGQHLGPIADALAKALGINVANADQQRKRQRQQKWLAMPTNHRAPIYGTPIPQNTLPLYEIDFSLVTDRFREMRLVRGSGWRPRVAV